MSKFKPGKSGNPQGRPKGSKNKTTTEIKEKWREVLENQMQNLEQDLESMKPEDRVKLIASISEFFIPKLQRQSIGIENANDFLSFLKETSMDE
jgi:hypothetical protein